MRSLFLLTSLLGLTITFATGCASSKHSTATTQSASAGQPCAECLVCKKNADLACVEVTVDESTPSYQYAGKTYYFCSDECKNSFAKHPAKYATK